MYYYRGPVYRQDERFFPFLFGAPLIGGFLGGFLGASLARPRPYYPYPPPRPFYPYGGPPVPYGYGYGNPYGY